MALNPVNYLCLLVGALNFTWLVIVTIIIIRREPKERLNWLFASSFIFLAIAYALLPIGAFTHPENDPTVMLILTKSYATALITGAALMCLSALAINYSTRFVTKPSIVIPTICLIVIAVGLTFGLPKTSDVFYSLKAVPGEGANVQMSLFFMAIFYPIGLAFIIPALVCFLMAYRQTSDAELKLRLRYFIIGFIITISSLVPSLLSNFLEDVWSEAQILNGLEFIMVATGITVMSGGFLTGIREKSLEAQPEEKDLEIQPEEKDSEIQPEEKDLEIQPEEKDLEIQPEEKDLEKESVI